MNITISIKNDVIQYHFQDNINYSLSQFPFKQNPWGDLKIKTKLRA